MPAPLEKSSLDQNQYELRVLNVALTGAMKARAVASMMNMSTKKEPTTWIHQLASAQVLTNTTFGGEVDKFKDNVEKPSARQLRKTQLTRGLAQRRGPAGRSEEKYARRDLFSRKLSRDGAL